MMHAKTDSYATSYGLSSHKKPAYNINSPSGDSHNASNSPMETPAFGNPTFEEKGNGKLNKKGWPDCKVIDEEGGYDEFYHDRKKLSRKIWFFIAIIEFLLIFSFFCFITCAAASFHHKPQLTIKSLTLHNLYFGVGSDKTGLQTKTVRVNCSMQMTVHNPATFFNIYVSSKSINLMYSEITVAPGEALTVNLQGSGIPFYDAGATLSTDLVDSGKIPMMLVFEVKLREYVVGLVNTKHTQHVSCSVVIDFHNNKAILLEDNACIYI